MKRLPVIRHIRAAIFCFNCNRHYDAWRSVGFIGGWTAEELAHWEAIKRGEA